MAIFEAIPTLVQILLFPIIVIGLWVLIFNSKNSYFTRLVVEGGYLIFVIPLMVLTFLSIPMVLLLFWATATGNNEISYALLGILVGVSIIIEYFYIKRMIRQLEERERMKFFDIIRRELKRETHEKRRVKKEIAKKEAVIYFDEISKMNKKKRELDRDQKENLRRALLGDIPTHNE